MNRVVRFIGIVLVSLSCIVFTLFQTMQSAPTLAQSTIEAPPIANIAQNLNFEQCFQDLGIEGSTGKTCWVGFADDVTPKIGWCVGYLEKGEDVYFFATNIDIWNENDSAARIELTRRCFKV